jgi:hypothetical protein
MMWCGSDDDSSNGLRILKVDPVLVRAALHVGHQVGGVQVPLHGFADAGIEDFGWLPAEFGFELIGLGQPVENEVGAGDEDGHF